MKKVTTSIIILTKNRAQFLRKNLSRLAQQTVKPSEIVIINNDSTDKTPEVIKKYSRVLPIRAFKTDVRGYPRLYNLGIKKTSKKLICFLDDDCLAKKDWLEKVIESHQKYPDCVIQAQTFSLPKNNIYAQIMGDHYQNWLQSNLINQRELKVLDNKNTAVPKKILVKYGAFSEQHSVGSEDLELGIRLRKKGIKIIFAPKAIAWHHERATLREFVRQHYRIAQSEALLDNKLEKKEKIGVLPKNKIVLHLKSALKKESEYFTKGRIINALQLPFIYLLLILIRSFGYSRK